jgi:ATP phosphoribosyltransferase
MNKLKIALPKGSLQDSTLMLFEHAGFQMYAGTRSYYLSTDDPEVEGVLLRAQEIPRYVEMGAFDSGISGRDWIVENRVSIVEVCDLVYSKQGFRPVKIVLAVPEGSSIKKPKDLEGKLIATELVNLTRDYLKKNRVEARVEFSYGATEIKAGKLVDAIVEITETGNTLVSHNLKIVDTIMESVPKLITNKRAWQDKWKREKISNIALLLKGALEAEGKVGIKMNLKVTSLEKILKILPAMKNPTVSPLTDRSWVAVETIIDRKMAKDLIPQLKKFGAQDIVEYPLNKVI